MNINNNNNKTFVCECNICYEKVYNNSIINLKCCNSTKNICVDCLNCLTTPICPYCRNKMDNSVIPYLNNITNINNSISHSDNISFYFNRNNNFEDIYYVNPYSYSNTKDLIRQIRNRRLEHKQHTITYPKNKIIKNKIIKNKYLKNKLNIITQNYNNNIQNDIDINEDIFQFEL